MVGCPCSPLVLADPSASCSTCLAVALILRSAVRHDRRRRGTFGTATPVDDLGFVDLVVGVVRVCQAWGVTDGTVGIDHPAAGSADEMVMVVADAVLVTGWRACWLDTSDDPLIGEGSESVVHGLERDRADLGPDGRVDLGGGAVRSLRHSAQNRQTLGRDLHTVPAQESSLIDEFPHRSAGTLALILEESKYLSGVLHGIDRLLVAEVELEVGRPGVTGGAEHGDSADERVPERRAKVQQRLWGNVCSVAPKLCEMTSPRWWLITKFSARTICGKPCTP